MFTITITNYTAYNMTIEVQWPDLPFDGKKTNAVVSKEAGVVFVIRVQRDALKSIVTRYIDQRFYALKGDNTALRLKHNVGFLKKKSTLSDVCSWIKEHERQLSEIMPLPQSKHNRWRELIKQVFDFSEAYHPGMGREKAIQKIQPLWSK